MSAPGRDSLIRNTLLYMPAQLLGPMLQFATTIIWTHQLDPVGYGVVTFVVAAQELSGFIGLSWWTLYVLRFLTRHDQSGGEAELRAMDSRMAAFSAVVQCIFAAPIVLSFGSADMRLLSTAALYLILRTLLVHYGEWARAQNRIRLYTAAQLVGPACGAVLSMLFIHLTDGGAVAGLAGLATGQALGLFMLVRALGLSFSARPVGRKLVLAALRFGLPLIVAAIAAWLASNGIRLLVQWREGNAAVGILSVGWGLGQRIASVLAMLCAAAAFPLAVRRMEGGDRTGAIGQIGLNGALMYGIVAPAAVGIAMLARPFVDLLIGEAYREATVVILPLAFIAMSVKTIKIHTVDQTSLLLERTRVTMWLNVVEAVSTLTGCGVGLFFGGLAGAVAGTLGGMLGGGAIAFSYGARVMHLHIPLDLLARISAACGIMAGALALFPAPTGAAALLVNILAGAISYALGLCVAVPELRRDVRERILRR